MGYRTMISHLDMYTFRSIFFFFVEWNSFGCSLEWNKGRIIWGGSPIFRNDFSKDFERLRILITCQYGRYGNQNTINSINYQDAL